MAWVDSCLLRTHSLLTAVLHCILTWQKDGGTSGVSVIQALIQFMRVLPHDLIASQRPVLLVPLPWGLGFQYINFGRT